MCIRDSLYPDAGSAVRQRRDAPNRRSHGSLKRRYDVFAVLRNNPEMLGPSSQQESSADACRMAHASWQVATDRSTDYLFQFRRRRGEGRYLHELPTPSLTNAQASLPSRAIAASPLPHAD